MMILKGNNSNNYCGWCHSIKTGKKLKWEEHFLYYAAVRLYLWKLLLIMCGCYCAFVVIASKVRKSKCDGMKFPLQPCYCMIAIMFAFHDPYSNYKGISRVYK